MNVVITWSGKHSHEMALFLREWLKQVLPGMEPWVSSEDIQKGKKWFKELMSQFDKTRVSITCITPENVKSPWVYYEVGLIAAKQESVEEGIVCSYLVGVDGKHILNTPLAEFQWTEADKTDTWKLIKSINRELGADGHDAMLLEGNFKNQWPRLKNKIESVVAEVGKVEDAVTEVLQPQRAELRPRAKKLLVEASKDRNGDIVRILTSEGWSVSTNGKQMLRSSGPREAALWNGALEELIHHGFVEPRGERGEVIAVTDFGYEKADEILQKDPLFSLSNEGKQLLIEASTDQDGIIIFAKYDGGFQILTNNRQMVVGHDPRDAAGWRSGLKQLMELGMIELGDHESTYRVTTKGYDFAKEFKEEIGQA